MADVLLDKREDGVALITLNRPESLNSMGGTLVGDLGDALTECERDREVRCVAVTGAGRGFCSGGDVKGFAEGVGAGQQSTGKQGAAPDGSQRPREPGFSTRWLRWQERSGRLQRAHERTSLKLHTMLKPTVAIVNGPAAGAGMSLALSCDLRVFSDRGKIVPAFGRIGFSGDFGGSYFLSHLIGFGRAREIYFLGEEVGAQRCLELGIANRVVAHDELMDRALAYCGQIASGPPFAQARMKENFLAAQDLSVREALAQEARNMELTAMTRDYREGVRSFSERRPPEFIGE